MLRSTATLFAPLIAGVTLGVTNLISEILGKGIDWNAIMSEQASASFFGTADFALSNIRQEFFVLVVGIYVMQLVLLLIRFSNGIDEGDDRIQYMYALGLSLPAAVVAFSVVTIVSMTLFGGLA
jgi:hypothetical protein